MQIGIDLGATKIESVLLKENGLELHRDRIQSPKNYQKTISDITDIVNNIEKKFEKNLNVGGNALISGTTDATSSSTGALIVLGGAGIGKNFFVGEDAEIEGTTGSTSTNTGALVVRGGTGIAQNLFVGNDVNICPSENNL